MHRAGVHGHGLPARKGRAEVAAAPSTTQAAGSLRSRGAKTCEHKRGQRSLERTEIGRSAIDQRARDDLVHASDDGELAHRIDVGGTEQRIREPAIDLLAPFQSACARTEHVDHEHTCDRTIHAEPMQERSDLRG